MEIAKPLRAVTPQHNINRIQDDLLFHLDLNPDPALADFCSHTRAKRNKNTSSITSAYSQT